MMQSAYRTVKRLEGHHLVIDLPTDFPKTGHAEVIILSLDASDEGVGQILMREWLTRAWGCASDFPDRPDQLPLDSVESL
jgi:hypothetical protein